jgi:hypothetical protein
MNDSGDAIHASWKGSPLCCGYLLVRFDEVHVQIHQDTATHHALLYWATGVASDGQHEVLGVWALGSSGLPDWRYVFDDLAVRGVEQIDVLISDASSAGHASLPGVTAPRPVVRRAETNCELGQESSPRLRRSNNTAKLAAESMQAELIRLVGRHGSFDSLASAVDFLGHALQRLDRRFWTAHPTPARFSLRRRPVAASRLAAA